MVPTAYQIVPPPPPRSFLPQTPPKRRKPRIIEDSDFEEEIDSKSIAISRNKRNKYPLKQEEASGTASLRKRSLKKKSLSPQIASPTTLHKKLRCLPSALDSPQPVLQRVSNQNKSNRTPERNSTHQGGTCGARRVSTLQTTELKAADRVSPFSSAVLFSSLQSPFHSPVSLKPTLNSRMAQPNSIKKAKSRSKNTRVEQLADQEHSGRPHLSVIPQINRTGVVDSEQQGANHGLDLGMIQQEISDYEANLAQRESQQIKKIVKRVPLFAVDPKPKLVPLRLTTLPDHMIFKNSKSEDSSKKTCRNKPLPKATAKEALSWLSSFLNENFDDEEDRNAPDLGAKLHESKDVSHQQTTSVCVAEADPGPSQQAPVRKLFPEPDASDYKPLCNDQFSIPSTAPQAVAQQNLKEANNLCTAKNIGSSVAQEEHFHPGGPQNPICDNQPSTQSLLKELSRLGLFEDDTSAATDRTKPHCKEDSFRRVSQTAEAPQCGESVVPGHPKPTEDCVQLHEGSFKVEKIYETGSPVPQRATFMFSSPAKSAHPNRFSKKWPQPSVKVSPSSAAEQRPCSSELCRSATAASGVVVSHPGRLLIKQKSATKPNNSTN